jgi:hypothetical protein
MLTRHGQHHDRANDREDGDKGNGEAFATPACRTPGRAQNADNLNNTKGDVEKNGLEVGIAEVADDEVAESGYAATRYAVRTTLVAVPRYMEIKTLTI